MNPAQVICLFQRFDGMDVLLYTIYVQEYGDNPNCGSPNKKWVYLSYLDSVQYLRPKVPAANYGGLTLRTMVYHELLIGYLDYIKAHGFTSMFIWACPPTAVRSTALLSSHPHPHPHAHLAQEGFSCTLYISFQHVMFTFAR